MPNRKGRIRTDRVAVQLKKELSSIISELRDPKIAGMMCSVTSASVSDDFSYAKVGVSVLGSKQDKEIFIDCLRKASGSIRKKVGQRIKLMHTPQLDFRLDHSIEEGARIIDMINNISKSDTSENNN